jgi:uncharacterized protein YpbB
MYDYFAMLLAFLMEQGYLTIMMNKIKVLDKVNRSLGGMYGK